MNSRKKTVEERLGVLRDDLGALRAEVANGAGDVSELAEKRAGGVIQSAADLAERAFRLAEETARDWKGDVEDWGNTNLDSARKSVRTQPLSAIAIAIGAGVVLGGLFLRR